MADFYSSSNYREYLKTWISEQPKRGRGLISAMAKAAGCQPVYFSRVLLEKAQLSLEQAQAIQRLLGHSNEEVDFFLLLVEWDRAGNKALKNYFWQKIETAREARINLQARFTEAKSLTIEHQNIYYSSYQYAAVHACISVPAFQTVDALEAVLKIPRERLLEVLSFLRETGLAIEERGRFRVGLNRLHLGKDAGLIRQHHSNWRIEALKSLDRGKGAQSDQALHYSAVVSLSEADAVRLREHWVRALEEFNRQIAPSKEEAVRALVIDFFSLN
ncbi:hypothetical protein WDW37_21280 [Bdellovibrionota bacterium FG-1]